MVNVPVRCNSAWAFNPLTTACFLEHKQQNNHKLNFRCMTQKTLNQKLMLKKTASLMMLLVLMSTTLVAQNRLSEKLPVDPNVKMGKLANGLTYYIRKNVKPEKKVELR